MMAQYWTPSAWKNAFYQGSDKASVDYAYEKGGDTKVMFSTNDSMEG